MLQLEFSRIKIMYITEMPPIDIQSLVELLIKN
jgi:hypothetical protein